MSFELHLSIPDSSPAVQLVQERAKSARISPEEAATQLLIEAAGDRARKKSPGWEMVGLLSSDEDVALLEDAMTEAQRRRQHDHPRELEDQ